MQVKRRTGKVRRPKTDDLPLCHTVPRKCPRGSVRGSEECRTPVVPSSETWFGDRSFAAAGSRLFNIAFRHRHSRADYNCFCYMPPLPTVGGRGVMFSGLPSVRPSVRLSIVCPIPRDVISLYLVEGLR